ncbi:MAG: glycosyltransferase family 39 protein [Anaerolineae bacterium]
MAYLAIAVQYAARTPAWQVPDEPAHYNYVRAIVENRALPVLNFGDYDQAFNQQFTNPANTPDLPIDRLRYEFHQPPLYYLLAAPMYALTGGDLFALRFVSVALGGVLIVVAFLIVREITPDRPELALGTAAFVAFVPQHVAMLAGVNNDSLAELLLALILLQTFRVLRKGTQGNSGELLALGVVLGLGLVTKTTDYLAVPIVFVALLFSAYRLSPIANRAARIANRPSIFILHPSSFIPVVAPALILGALWWLRNLGAYGGFDILGLARHNAVVAGQPLTSDWITGMGFGPFLVSALTTTFHSFWGQFGWMGVPMPEWVYLGLGALSIAAVVGWLWTLRTNQATHKPTTYFAILLLLLVLFSFAAYLWYNLTFVQHQGRYLFPALIPLGLVFSIGIDRWSRLLPRPIGLAAYIGVFAVLAALDMVALYRFVIPSLTV